MFCDIISRNLYQGGSRMGEIIGAALVIGLYLWWQKRKKNNEA